MASKDRISFLQAILEKNQNVPYGIKKLNSALSLNTEH